MKEGVFSNAIRDFPDEDVKNEIASGLVCADLLFDFSQGSLVSFFDDSSIGLRSCHSYECVKLESSRVKILSGSWIIIKCDVVMVDEWFSEPRLGVIFDLPRFIDRAWVFKSGGWEEVVGSQVYSHSTDFLDGRTCILLLNFSNFLMLEEFVQGKHDISGICFFDAGLPVDICKLSGVFEGESFWSVCEYVDRLAGFSEINKKIPGLLLSRKGDLIRFVSRLILYYSSIEFLQEKDRFYALFLSLYETMLVSGVDGYYIDSVKDCLFDCIESRASLNGYPYSSTLRLGIFKTPLYRGLSATKFLSKRRRVALVQFWEGGALPRHVKEFGKLARCLGIDYQLFDKKKAGSFILSVYGDSFSNLFDKIESPAMQSDVFRVLYCASCDAAYIDADWVLEARRLADNPELMIFPQPGSAMFRVVENRERGVRYLANDFIYYYGTKFSEVVVNQLHENLSCLDFGSISPPVIHEKTGPGLIRSVLEKNGIFFSGYDLRSVVSIAGEGAPVYDTKLGEIVVLMKLHGKKLGVFPDGRLSDYWYEKGIAQNWRGGGS